MTVCFVCYVSLWFSYKSMSSSSGPQNPHNIYPYVERKKGEDELPPDYFSLLSLMFGLIGLMMKTKWGCWCSIICCFASLANAKHGQMDIKQMFASFSFAIVGLISNYFSPLYAEKH